MCSANIVTLVVIVVFSMSVYCLLLQECNISVSDIHGMQCAIEYMIILALESG